MERQPVVSSSIKSVGYDLDAQILEIEFHKYGTFRYRKVPELLFRGLMLANSKGEFFNGRIKDRYPFEEVGKP